MTGYLTVYSYLSSPSLTHCHCTSLHTFAHCYTSSHTSSRPLKCTLTKYLRTNPTKVNTKVCTTAVTGTLSSIQVVALNTRIAIGNAMKKPMATSLTASLAADLSIVIADPQTRPDAVLIQHRLQLR